MNRKLTVRKLTMGAIGYTRSESIMISALDIAKIGTYRQYGQNGCRIIATLRDGSTVSIAATDNREFATRIRKHLPGCNDTPKSMMTVRWADDSALKYIDAYCHIE